MGSLFWLIAVLLISMAAAYGLARWLTGLSRDWALRKGIVAHVSHRSSHSVPTARLGGVGLALGFAIASLVVLVAQMLIAGGVGGYISLHSHDMMIYQEDRALFYLGLLLGWLMMFSIGLLDDVYDLPPLVKLVLTILGSMAPVLGFFFSVGSWAAIRSDIWLIGIWSFWILFFVNAYNFMDGMDGFAGAFARQAAIFFFLIMIVRPWVHIHNPLYARDHPLYLLILAAACSGFLYWNNPPAKVFMGDCGSLSVGYLLGVYVIIGKYTAWSGPEVFLAPNRPWLCPVLPVLSSLTVLFPFIFDVTLTLIRRLRRGENILKAHREHLYQRLMKTGLSHGEVLRLTKKRFWACGVAALLGALPAHPAGRWAAFVFALGVMVHYWRLTLARERALSAQSIENK